MTPPKKQQHTLNVAMPHDLRGAIETARTFTGETVTGFIKAAIIDRLTKIREVAENTEEPTG